MMPEQYEKRLKRAAILIMLIVAVIFAVLSRVIEGIDTDPQGYNIDLLRGLGTELFGAVTVFLLLEDSLERHRQKSAEARSRKEAFEQLKGQLSSRINDVSRRAAEELGRQGWLRDGSLQKVSLHSANLQNAELSFADLREAQLFGANLIGAALHETNLQGAVCLRTDFQGASLTLANLRGAHLNYANFHQADLGNTDLRGANLTKANLEGAKLALIHLPFVGPDEGKLQLLYAMFDEMTILPDGSRWTPDTDLGQFTNFDHPNFWRSDDPISFAYRGKQL